jgi:sulfate adenylyltransferase subunit 2
MERLDHLEERSIYILREAYAKFKNLAMLWSVGKDSTVMLWLARKAFLGHVPFPLVHIDTGYEYPETLEWRDRLAVEWNLYMVYGINQRALDAGTTFPLGKVDRLTCCGYMRTEALKQTLSGESVRYRLNLTTRQYEPEPNREPYTGVIVGVRADEEGSRSKERYFSPRDTDNQWDLANQPPEFWSQYKTDFPPQTHVRIHPILDWTELNIWQYIERENIPMMPMYYDQGSGTRCRSLGCYPCTSPITSTARNAREVVAELETGQLHNIAERSGRLQDKEDGGLETLRKAGYM